MVVIDANIIIRAVLGERVRSLLIRYSPSVQFFAPEMAFEEAREHLPAILTNRDIPVEPALEVLAFLTQLIQPVKEDAYLIFRKTAQMRMINRDIDDWPILAAALALHCPIWTEDTDFFGAGVATWTTDRIEHFLIESERI